MRRPFPEDLLVMIIIFGHLHSFLVDESYV